MYFSITIPAFIFNMVVCYYSFSDIRKRTESAKTSPRIILMAMIIFGYLPGSLLVILTFLLNFKLLSYQPVCFMYVFFNTLYNLSTFSQFFLTVYMCLLIFTTLSKRKIDKLGMYFIYTSLVLLCITQFILVPIAGVNPSREKEFMGRTYPRYCDVSSPIVKAVFSGTGLFILFFSLVAGIVLSYIQLYRILYGSDKKQGRIIASFVCFALINLHGSVRYILVTILQLDIPDHFIYILADSTRFDAGLFALVYLLLDGRIKERPFTLELTKILAVSAIRKCFKNYLSELNETGRSDKNLVRQWEAIVSGNEKQNDEKKEQIRNNLEKRMELHLVGFFESSQWEQFYPEYCRMGKVDEQLSLR